MEELDDIKRYIQREDSKLCDRCKVLEFDDEKKGGTISFLENGDQFVSFGSLNEIALEFKLRDTLPDLPVLSASSDAGCVFCSTLKERILEDRELNEREHDELECESMCYLLEKFDNEAAQPFIECLLVPFKLIKNDEESSHAFRFYVQAATTDSCSKWLSIRRTPLANRILSDDGLKRLTSMVESSLENAKSPEKSSYLPTRLIDVGLKNDDANPKLIITRDEFCFKGQNDTDRRYLALSYCWGPPEEATLQLKTEKHSLPDRLREIRSEDLPQTLMDAVLVCRALKINYLWIDALCIIQGDKKDWERESYQMANVYSNAMITICAVQGSSCLSGFLQREIRPQINIRFTSSINPSISGTFSLFRETCNPFTNVEDKPIVSFLDDSDGHMNRVLSNGFLRTRYNSYKYDVDESSDYFDAEWSTRGWTLQEAWLSTRILFFGSIMMHMYVNGIVESEDSTYEDTCVWGQSFRIEKPEHEFFEDWRHLVTTYSSRDLSYQDDKFPAIAALAMRFGEQINGKYVAGLWTTDLHTGLLWKAHGADKIEIFFERIKSHKYIAPSWSWACQQEYTTWIWTPKTPSKPEFKLVDESMTIDGLNPYGRIKNGFLVLSTKMCKLPATNLRRVSTYLGITFCFELLSNKGQYIANLEFDWRHSSDWSESTSEDLVKGEDCENRLIEDLSMVLVSSRPVNDWASSTREVNSPEILLGYLVFPADIPGEYKRAGLFFTEDRGLGGRKFWNGIQTTMVKLI